MLVDNGKTGKSGYINIKGIYVIQPRFQQAFSFVNGFATVIEKNKWGCIDKKGNYVIKPIYEIVGHFSEGLCNAKLQGNKYFFFDEYGISKINLDAEPNLYDFVSSFREGLAIVGKNGFYGYINTNGKIVIPLIYEDAHEFLNGIAEVQKEGKIFYINKNGECVIFCPN
jgi:hypothetical protein